MITNTVDLLEEKNLWTIYKISVSRLGISLFNLVATSIVFLFLTVYCFIVPENFGKRIELTRSLAELGLGFGTTILGFLIAGFTIFATLTKPELFGRMNSVVDKKSGLSLLKINFFSFVEVFVVYLTFLSFCLLVKLFAGSGGVGATLIQAANKSPYIIYNLSETFVVDSFYIMFSTMSFYSLMALKSFVYNTYHTVMTSIAWVLYDAEGVTLPHKNISKFGDFNIEVGRSRRRKPL